MEIGDEGRSVGRYAGMSLEEIGDWEAGEILSEAVSPVADHLRSPHGGIRAGALLMLCDSVGGFTAGLAALPDGWVVSTNLTLTLAPHRAVGPLRLRSSVLRAGKAAIVTDVRVRDAGAGGAIVADAVLTSAVLVPEGGPPRWARPARMTAPALDEPLPPMEEWLALRAVSGAPAGVVEIEITPAIRNPWGILHGGVTAALVDLAASRACAADGGPPVQTGDVAVHFVAPARVGPVRAIATPLGTRADGTVVAVEVRDAGRDRLVVHAVATVRPA